MGKGGICCSGTMERTQDTKEVQSTTSEATSFSHKRLSSMK